MVVTEIELYEILSAKIGKQEAKALTEFSTREDLRKEISSLEIRLTRNMYIVGVVQFLAIVASVRLLLKFHLG